MGENNGNNQFLYVHCGDIFYNSLRVFTISLELLNVISSLNHEEGQCISVLAESESEYNTGNSVYMVLFMFFLIFLHEPFFTH